MSDFKGNNVDSSFGQSWQHTFNMSSGSPVAQQFQIESKLGDGGMGAVYRCKDLWLSRTVAIKFLHPHLASTSTSLLRFRQEAKAAALLNHPSIVRVHQMAFDSDTPFIVMDLVEGRSLSDVLRSEGAMEIDRALRIMIKVADALQHAHEHGVVHRDLKPSNILICEGDAEDVKVVDFGIAKILPTDGASPDVPTLTQTGELFGTPAYMSPEQLQGKAIDGRADQYSFACVLYECLTGAPPFTGTLVDVLVSHVKSEPLSMREASIGHTYPSWLEWAVSRMLSKTTDERYDSMNDVIEALCEPQKETQLTSVLPSPAVSSKTPYFIAAAATLIVASGAGAAFFMHASHNSAANKLSGPAENVVSSAVSSPDSGTARDSKASMNLPEYESQESKREHAGEQNAFVATVLRMAQTGQTEIRKAPGGFIGDEALRCLINLPQLTALNLNKCVRLTDESMKLLRDIQKKRNFDLKELSLHETFIGDVGLRYVSEITPLERVFASRMDNITAEGVMAICNLPNLSSLSLEGNDQLGPTGVASVSRAKALTWLNMSGVNCKNGAQFFNHLKLKYLDLSNCNLYDEDIDELVKIDTLEELNLKGNDKLSDRALKVLPKLKNLRHLSLSANSMESGNIVSFIKNMKPTQVSFSNRPGSE